MQRLFNLNKWIQLAEGSQWNFTNERKRKVRLEVNAPSPVTLHVIDDQGEVSFLALVEGRDVVEFVTTGRVSVAVEGGECWFYSEDSDDVSCTVVDPVKFTKIVERRKRSPELEYIAAQMNRNLELNLQKQAHELEQLFLRREEARAVQYQAAALAAGAGSKPAAAGGADASDPPPSASD